MLSISYSGFLPRNFQFAYAIKVSGLRYTSKLFRVEKNVLFIQTFQLFVIIICVQMSTCFYASHLSNGVI